MEVARIAEGLWRWTAYYGEWRDTVGCAYVETSTAIVLIDPLVPEEPEEEARFWKALDRDVKRASVPLHVLITVFWHTRSAGEIVHRYDGRLHVVSRARAAVRRRTDAVTDAFHPGETLPGEIVPFTSGRATEVVYWIPAHRTLVPGDVLLGDEGGGLRLCPETWLPDGVGHARLRDALSPLLALPVERVLVSHGAPVLEHAHEALAEALRSS